MEHRPARRALDIPPFMVMDVMEAAARLEREGRSIVHMEVGEPDFPTPECVRAAAERALRDGETRYTHSMGLPALREAICEWHHANYGVTVDPERVIVTSGTSPAFLLALSALIEPGDEVVLTDPHYACNPNMVRFLGGRCVFAPLSEERGWRPDPADLRRALTPRTRAILVGSPANPTGAVLPPEDLAAIAEIGAEAGVPVVSDEIYHGLTYGGARARSIHEFTPDAFVLNGFSKRTAMTGWRLGYLIAPPAYIRPMQKVQQNFFISASSFVQRAGIAALREAQPDVDRMVAEYGRRRLSLVESLRRAGFSIPVPPEGAFYVLADARRFSPDSRALAFELLREAGVACTPGVDFGSRAEGHLRFSYANSPENLAEGVRRVEECLKGREGRT